MIGLGRLLLPIEFKEKDGVVLVRELPELKQRFNENYIKDLFVAIHNGRLEQFFYAHGKDEIRNLIRQLKESNKSDLEILNEVAKALGLEEIKGKNLEFYIMRQEDNLQTILQNDKIYVTMLPNIYTGNNINITLKNKKTLTSQNKQSTKIEYNKIIINLQKDIELTLENLTFDTKDIEINGGNVFFRDIIFNDVNFNFKDCNITFYSINCDNLEKLSIKSEDSNIKINNCKLNFSNTSIIQGGEINIEESEIILLNTQKKQEEDSYIFKLSNAKSTINSTNIKDGGIYLQNSVLKISNSEIINSGYYGIESINSTVEGNGCKIYDNKNGLWFKENSRVELIRLDVFKNGNQNDSKSQILVVDSTLSIKDSQVRDSVNADGIYGKGSKIKAEGCKIFGNFYNGLSFGWNSEVELISIDVFKNGNQNDSNSQILVGYSILSIKDSQVRDSVNAAGIYGRGSKIKAEGCKIYGNFYNGLFFMENSDVELIGLDVFKNGNKNNTYPQIWVESSKLNMVRSVVHDAVRGEGIFIKRKSNVRLMSVTTYNNLGGVRYTYISPYHENCNFKDGISKH